MRRERDLAVAAEIITRIARENKATEDAVRADMTEALRAGARDPDPSVEACWREFSCSGREPTLEELILWLAERAVRNLQP